ncbi:MAG TPA: FtsH protease activity modulator HflK [Acidobacteriota bacterium]|nr:FtsH protease activity modulator HflK [Acidobacteriota bacterium]
MDRSPFNKQPSLDDTVGAFIDRLRRFQFKGKPLLRLIVILIAVILLFGSFYQIQPEQVGVVLRFGKFIRTTDPGLRVKIPFAENVIKVPVQRQLKQEFGFRTEDPAISTRYSSRLFLEESLMLTGDLNVVVAEWIVQYRISDPYLFLFKVRNVEDTFRSMNEAVVREIIGDRTVTEVLTVGRLEIETSVQQRLQELCNQYQTGIVVEQVVLQNVNPPDPVKPSWDEVNQAQQQRDRLINEARAEYNKIIPRAKGEAEQAILQAEGYALNRINRAQGDAARFIDLHEAYRRAPVVTRQRMYLETMQRILPRIGGKLFIDTEAKGVMPLIPVESLQNILGRDAAERKVQP